MSLAAPLLPDEPRSRRSTSVQRAVQAFRSLNDRRQRAVQAFRAANRAALEGAERISLSRASSFQALGSLTPSKELPGSHGHLGLGWLQVAVILWSHLTGAGLVALPFALAKAGWAGLWLIVGATLVTAHTGKLQLRTFESVNGRKRRQPQHMGEGFCVSGDQLAQEALGPAGGICMQLLTLVECGGSAVCLLVLHGANWPAVVAGVPMTGVRGSGLDGWPRCVAVVCCGACVYGLLLLSAKELSRLASHLHPLAGALFCIQFCVLLLAPPPPGTFPCAADDLGTSVTMTAGSWVDRGGGGVAVGVVLFCFAGHSTLPALHAQMAPEHRHLVGRAVDLGFGAAAACLCAFGAAGYALFGGCCAEAITVTLLGASPVLGRLVSVAFLSNALLMTPVWLGPVVRIVLGWCGREAAHVRASASGQALLRAVRLGLVATATLVATLVPSYGAAAAMMGGLVTALTAVLLPALFHLLLVPPPSAAAAAAGPASGPAEDGAAAAAATAAADGGGAGGRIEAGEAGGGSQSGADAGPAMGPAGLAGAALAAAWAERALCAGVLVAAAVATAVCLSALLSPTGMVVCLVLLLLLVGVVMSSHKALSLVRAAVRAEAEGGAPPGGPAGAAANQGGAESSGSSLSLGFSPVRDTRRGPPPQQQQRRQQQRQQPRAAQRQPSGGGAGGARGRPLPPVGAGGGLVDERIGADRFTSDSDFEPLGVTRTDSLTAGELDDRVLEAAVERQRWSAAGARQQREARAQFAAAARSSSIGSVGSEGSYGSYEGGSYESLLSRSAAEEAGQQVRK